MCERFECNTVLRKRENVRRKFLNVCLLACAVSKCAREGYLPLPYLKSESMNSNILFGLYATTFGDSPEKEIYRHFETSTGITIDVSLSL
jgi:hypothetical protein